MKTKNLLGDTERECLGNGEKGGCLNQQSYVCVCEQAMAVRKNDFFFFHLLLKVDIQNHVIVISLVSIY